MRDISLAGTGGGRGVELRDMNEFLRNLAMDSPVLWAVFVLGVVATFSLGLYTFWEGFFALLKGARGRKQSCTKGRH